MHSHTVVIQQGPLYKPLLADIILPSKHTWLFRPNEGIKFGIDNQLITVLTNHVHRSVVHFCAGLGGVCIKRFSSP
jgi:hypothetical protein